MVVGLLLQIVVDGLLAVLTVGSVADMHPIRAFRIVLPDELVELTMRLDPCEPLLALLNVTTDAEVCRLALQVLRVANTANGIV